ncbi:MAG: flagellar hook-basal body complex protein FliE [Candidatus Eremiobacteraeota bacterium]|nr:flagellar hook-basal body complex protein FliE [Candidatus Eremiobacteraeota bacterium]
MNPAGIPALGPIDAGGVPALAPAITLEPLAGPAAHSFSQMLSGLVEGTAAVLSRADDSAGSLAAGTGSIADASLARAKADVVLEVVAVAASRLSGALSTLMQTQV